MCDGADVDRDVLATCVHAHALTGMAIDFNEVHLKGVIGSGAFATVFKAVYR